MAVVASVASTGLAVAEEPAPAAVAPPTAVATPPAAVAEPLHRRIDAEVERVARAQFIVGFRGRECKVGGGNGERE